MLGRGADIRVPCSAAECLSPRVTGVKVGALWEGEAVRNCSINRAVRTEKGLDRSGDTD